jgi:glycosyltransferase involved in cell wall biosynthesis
VTVNGKWPGQLPHIHSFFNPCLTNGELEEGKIVAERKSLEDTLRLLFVGRLDSAKGVGRILEIVRRLRSAGCAAHIDLVGDGPERPSFEDLCRSNALEEFVQFHGWKARTELGDFYGRAHILLIPSTSSEGWPKVLSEAMAYGVVPLASTISCIPQYLTQFETGHAFSALDVEPFVRAALWYTENPQQWKHESQNCVRAARFFSYRYYLDAVQKLLDLA